MQSAENAVFLWICGHAAIGVGGSFCWKNRANSALPESGFVRLSRAKGSVLLICDFSSLVMRFKHL